MSDTPEDETFDFDPDDFDPEKVAAELSGAGTGAKKLCIRAIRCSRNMTCEHVQDRGMTCVLEDLFVGKSSDLGDCENWVARKELNTSLDVSTMRRKAGVGRHNNHADRLQAKRSLLAKAKAGQPLPVGMDRELLIRTLEDDIRKAGKLN